MSDPTTHDAELDEHGQGEDLDEYVSDVQGEDLDLSNAVDVGNPAYVGVDPTYQNSASVTNAPFVSDEERDVFHAGKASETSKARVSRLPGSVA